MLAILAAACGGEPGRQVDPAVDSAVAAEARAEAPSTTAEVAGPAMSVPADDAAADSHAGADSGSAEAPLSEVPAGVSAEAPLSEATAGVSAEAPADPPPPRETQAAGSVPAADVEPEEPLILPAPSARTGQGLHVARLVLPERPLTFTQPDEVRGIYVNAWAAGSRGRSQALIDLAGRTEINAFVIDLKDASGYVSYPTSVTLAREVGADQEIRIRDLVGLLERLRRAGIYPIARIVIVKDALLTRVRPDLAVQDTAGGVWVDGKGLVWANLHDPEVWEYHVALAREAAAMGFPEIQWDYLRFPDAPEEELARAVYPGSEGRSRTDAVRAFLDYAAAELADLDLTMTMDVFGVTTSATNDVGIGQLWERFIGAVDVALPMVYPSHYWIGSFGIDDPNGHPYEIVHAALSSGMKRSAQVEGAGTIRPWLQDFTLGSPKYGAPEVRAQIQATYDAGVREWVLWNPSSRYSEAALAPASGYPEGTEPTMRVAGRIVAVSQRKAALEAEAMARASADSTVAEIVPDTVGIH